MDFIFNINNAPETTQDNKELETILGEIEQHFEDWQNYFNLYSMFAPPPTDNSKQIQQWYKELKTDFLRIVSNYNNKVNKFADIQEISADEVQDIVKGALNTKGKPTVAKETKKDSTNTMMYS
tara:strand:- start:764 stop:1132 length:369 start_codon:yes stop_codon:yes gene_type:complete